MGPIILSAAVPILEALAPKVIPFLVTEAEKVFGPKTGQVKDGVLCESPITTEP